MQCVYSISGRRGMNRYQKAWQRFIFQPKRRFKQMLIGTGIFFVGVVIVYLAAGWESQWVFYGGAVLMVAGVIVAAPGYLGILLWRLIGKRNR
ncbi:hypothetical protein [Pleionea sp. CnH1-48]|uniref:hypothetical protein n=1 Tax=Pleionea sp. CnH1-48 TaxID=2954494 RepID=UPI00209794E6|nr:hypothetical protein [Pleionea sp. CnH1-48]MCO7225672.1 hypothetical protein [Pleionea sp. CnH1-48]